MPHMSKKVLLQQKRKKRFINYIEKLEIIVILRGNLEELFTMAQAMIIIT